MEHRTRKPEVRSRLDQAWGALPQVTRVESVQFQKIPPPNPRDVLSKAGRESRSCLPHSEPLELQGMERCWTSCAMTFGDGRKPDLSL
jgi:hypothetical protein